MLKKILPLLTASLLLLPVARAADHDHHVALFLGATSDSHHAHFTSGLDYEYRFDTTFGIGVLGDVVWSNPNHTVVGVPLFLHPVGEWKIFAAPGLSFVSGHSHYNTRVGTGYDFALSDDWSLGPMVAADFSKEAHPHWVYGLSLGIGF